MQHTSTNNHTIIVHMTDQEFDRLLALHKRFDSRISDNELLKRCMRIVSGMGTMEMREGMKYWRLSEEGYQDD